MTTPIKTQCPHCQACFKVQQTQLNKVNATVSCDQCQKSFLVNKHLIVTPDSSDSIATSDNSNSDALKATKAPISQTDATSHGNLSTKPSPHKQHVTELSPDTLIHDDMDIDELEEDHAEYDSLDSMDAWLTQAGDSTHDTAVPTATNHSSSASLNQAKTPTHPSLAKPSSTTTSMHASPAQVAISSAATNDIHANVDTTADNAWLEALLKEESKDDDSWQENTQRDDTDLSQILANMGVPFKDEDKTHEERVKKVQAQAKFAPSPARHSVASLLWILGCAVLALLLLAQYVIFNLETLVKNPAHAERLQAICSVAACSLPSADLTALTITNINHKSSQIKTTGTHSDVSATLNNQSEKAQLYPNVKVSVYGKNDLIGEFIATPADYLLSKQSQLTANSRQQLLFTIPVGNAQIREVTINALY